MNRRSARPHRSPRRSPAVRTGPGFRARGRRPLRLPVGPARRRRRPTDPHGTSQSGRATPAGRRGRIRTRFPDPTPTGLRSSRIAGRPAGSRFEERARPVPWRRRPPDGSGRVTEPSRRSGDETTWIAQSASRVAVDGLMILAQGCAPEIPIGERTEPSSPRLGSRKHESTTTRNRRAAPATKASDEDRAAPLALFVVSYFRAFVIKGPAWHPGPSGGRSPPILAPRRRENKPVSRWSALRGPLSFRPHPVNAYRRDIEIQTELFLQIFIIDSGHARKLV